MSWILVTIWLNGVSVVEFSKEKHCQVVRDHIRAQTTILGLIKTDCVVGPSK